MLNKRSRSDGPIRNAPRRAADFSRGDKEALTKEKTAAAAPGTALEDPSRNKKIPLSNPWRGVRDECPLTRQANLLNASLAASGAGLDARCAEYCSSLLREIDPRCVKALFRRARALANLGRFDDAEDDLGYAERLEPHLKTREGGVLRRAIRDARAREDDARGAARGGASLERAFERVFGGGGIDESGDGSEKKKNAAEKRKAHERGERFEDPNDARGGEEPRLRYASEAALYLGPGASEADRALFREGNKGGGDKGASSGGSSKFADQPSHTDAFNANGLDALEPDEPTREDRCRFAVRRAAELEDQCERQRRMLQELAVASEALAKKGAPRWRTSASVRTPPTTRTSRRVACWARSHAKRFIIAAPVRSGGAGGPS